MQQERLAAGFAGGGNTSDADEAQIVYAFLDAMNEANPAWMAFVRARGVGAHVEEDARAQVDTFRRGFDRNV